jgi:hypothetical protein
MRIKPASAFYRLFCFGLFAVLLVILAGCAPKEDEPPKGAGYYTGPMNGKKVQASSEAAPAGPGQATAPSTK